MSQKELEKEDLENLVSTCLNIVTLFYRSKYDLEDKTYFPCNPCNISFSNYDDFYDHLYKKHKKFFVNIVSVELGERIMEADERFDYMDALRKAHKAAGEVNSGDSEPSLRELVNEYYEKNGRW